MSRQLEDILSEKLYHAEMELPDGDWDVLAQKMATEKRKKRFAVAWWWTAVAACVVVTFLAVNFVDNNTKTQNVTANTESQKIEQEPPVTTENLVAKTETTQPKRTASKTTNKKQQTSTSKAQSAEKVIVEPKESKEEAVRVAEKVEETKETVAQPTEKKESEKTLLAQNSITPEEAEQLLNTTKTTVASNDFARWSVSLASATTLLTSTPRKMVNDGRMMAPKPGAYTAQHDFPVTFGVQVGVAIIPRLDIQTGLSYTFLRSKFDYYNKNEIKNQQCHYLGIPLMLSYRFVDRSIVKCYASAGGMLEKGLVQDVETLEDGLLTNKEKNSIAGVQWSIAANVGVSISLYKGLNLYVEPGCSWYIPNSKTPQPETKRTELPINFNLAMGLRFNFDKK